VTCRKDAEKDAGRRPNDMGIRRYMLSHERHLVGSSPTPAIMNDKNYQIAQALELAKTIKLNKKDGEMPQNKFVREGDVMGILQRDLNLLDATFEIKYKFACTQLGFTDPDVLDHVKRKLLNGIDPQQNWSLHIQR
jgi:hypothetical protein